MPCLSGQVPPSLQGGARDDTEIRVKQVPSEFENQGGDGLIEAQVKWYNARKGFGFVLGPDGQDVFFHASALTEAGIEPPDTGDTLVCEIGTDRQGRRLVTRITEMKRGEGGGAAGAVRRPFREGGGGFGDRPPRRDFGGGGGGGYGDRGPRRDFGGGGGFGGPRRDFGGGGAASAVVAAASADRAGTSAAAVAVSAARAPSATVRPRDGISTATRAARPTT